MAKAPSGQFQTVVKRMLATPPQPHKESKVGKPKPGIKKQTAKRLAKGRASN